MTGVERTKQKTRNANIFSQKTYTTIIRTYWATKYESRSKANFGWLAAVCVMHVDIISFKNLKVISWGKKGKAKHFYPSKKSVIMGLFMRLNLPRVSYRSAVERPLAQIGRSTFESYQEHFFRFFPRVCLCHSLNNILLL